MLKVICMVILVNNSGIYNNEAVQAFGLALNSDHEEWIVDFHDYFQTHSQYTKYNKEVQHVNSNDCAILGELK